MKDLKMSAKKRSRKIKSANKLLKRQRAICEAESIMKITTIVAGCTATIASIRAAQFQAVGNKEKAKECIKSIVENVPVNNKKFKTVCENGIKIRIEKHIISDNKKLSELLNS